MNNDYKLEIINYINENNLHDVFTVDNIFYNNYNCNLFVYIRVSTEAQGFERQIEEIYKWAKKKNVVICIDYIFLEKYTGKRIYRPQYQEMKQHIKQNDYLVTTNLSRLGRNWDEIKKEWYEMDTKQINKIIIDNNNLCVELPNEKKQEVNLNSKMIQDITFSACLYSACIKIKEVSESTKAGLEVARKNGKTLGKPKGKYSTRENFIETLRLKVNGASYKQATNKTLMPVATFRLWLDKYKKETDIYNNAKILELLEKGEL